MESSLFSLRGRTALVTAGNGGLGRAIALGLRAAGAQVVASGRHPEKNAAIADELGEEAFLARPARRGVGGRRGRPDGGGVRPARRSGQLRRRLQERFRRRHAARRLERVLGSHLTGTFLCSKHAARALVAGGEGGKIVNVGSMYSLFGPPKYANYAAAKPGIVGLTRALAVELAAHGTQVNAVLPGWFKTDLTQGAWDTPWGRTDSPEDPRGEVGRARRPRRDGRLPRLACLGLRDRGRPAGRRRLRDRGSPPARVIRRPAWDVDGIRARRRFRACGRFARRALG